LKVEPSFAKPNLSLVVADWEALNFLRKLENSLRVAQHSDHLRLFHKNVNIFYLVVPFLKSVRILCLKPIQANIHIMEWMLPKILSMKKGGS
jgi:hypothetical protein